MITRNLFLLAAILILFTGCPAGPATQGGGTSDGEIGQLTKDQIEAFLTKAEKAPSRAKGDLSLLLESLEGSAERSEAFAKVRDEAKKLQELFQSNAGKSELNQQMTSLRAASDQLPTPGT
ncbi:hypothetical protein [Bremerella alba]|uniref:Lipoprotein n=1 Tax=Bremerella alba TaxID=980252 RepID=A0A7V8V1U3_9BACT|nr:hypothetical protein [Bremerella alba]MBA2113094.1 hypothetical protein [Bremerella alba]